MEVGVTPGGLPPKHLCGVVGARHVILPGAKEDDARLAVRDAIRLGGAVVFTGASGTSKTYIAVCIAERLAIPCTYVEVPKDVRGNDLHVVVLEGLRGPDTFDDSAPRRRLRGWIKDDCRVRRLCILDEIHLSGSDGRNLVRYLIGQPGNQTAFLLVGEHVATWIDADPAFDSRIARWVDFPESTPEEIAAFARAFHPLYETASDSLLKRVAEYAGVHKRKWARMIETCLTITDGTATKLSPALIAEARRVLGS